MRPFAPKTLQYQLQTLDNLVWFVQHKTVVAGEVWLAFRAIHNNRINGLVFWRGKLYVRGKGRAAQSDNAGRLNTPPDIVCGKRFERYGQFSIVKPGVFFRFFYNYRR